MATRDLHRLITQLEADPSLSRPSRMRKRLAALDELDAYLGNRDLEALEAGPQCGPIYERALAIGSRLEAVNSAIYRSIRSQLQGGGEPLRLLRWIQICRNETGAPTPGLGYDDLDELISGVLALREPGKADILAGPEMVFYQPTPVRHIIDLIKVSAPSKEDVLVDLGSGLGHVPMLTSILTGSRGIGIELETAYIESARECAERLGLSGVTFLHQDVREADLSLGTVFYLYTPFTGTLLRSVLDRLRSESAARAVKVCTLGPCTSVIANEPWLRTGAKPDADRITCFWSNTRS